MPIFRKKVLIFENFGIGSDENSISSIGKEVKDWKKKIIFYQNNFF